MTDKRIKSASLYSPQGAKAIVEGEYLWVTRHHTGHIIRDRDVENRVVAVVPGDWVIVLVWP